MYSPGWFPESRYWNGSAWTSQVQIQGPVVLVERPPADWNALSILSFVFSVGDIGGMGSILAIVFAHFAIKQIDASAGRQKGRIFAAIGLTLGCVSLTVTLFFVLAVVVVGFAI